MAINQSECQFGVLLVCLCVCNEFHRHIMLQFLAVTAALYVTMSVCLSVCLSVHLSSVCLSVCLSVDNKFYGSVMMLLVYLCCYYCCSLDKWNIFCHICNFSCDRSSKSHNVSLYQVVYKLYCCY